LYTRKSLAAGMFTALFLKKNPHFILKNGQKQLGSINPAVLTLRQPRYPLWEVALRHPVPRIMPFR
jgi:hypothetical protein